jgi:UPF0271 protein
MLSRVARVLLNIDAGEYPDEPEALFELAHVVSIACGGHAGDEASMERALGRCARFGTRAGAHPSFVDREGFGRRALAVGAAMLEGQLVEQMTRLSSLATGRGQALSYVKPHGALYHAATGDSALAEAVVRAAARAMGGSFTIIGPAGSALEHAARGHGLPFAREGFADRGTRPDGSLVPRTEPGALITDPNAARARTRALVASGRVDTVCVHADTPGSMGIARAVKEELDARGNADAPL